MNPSSRPRTRIAPILIGAVVCACVLPVHAEWLIDVDAGALYNSNLTRAQNAVDRRPDRAVAFAVSAGQFFALTGFDGVTMSLDARGEAYDRYHGLNFIGIGASATYRHKFGLGIAAPFLALGVAMAHDDYRIDVRDSNRIELRAEFGRRFDESFDAGVGAVYDRRYAKTNVRLVPRISGAIFDLGGHSAYVRAGYALSEQLLLGARASVRRGDVESTSQRSRQVFLASDAIANDPAFGDPNLFGYRLRGTTWTGSATMSYALNDRAAVNLGYLDERTDAAEGLEYRSRIVNASFAYRF